MASQIIPIVIIVVCLLVGYEEYLPDSIQNA